MAAISELRLLPNVFKKVGAGLILLVIATTAAKAIFHFEINVAYKELIKIIVFDTLIIGLLLFALAKDKIEDEMTLHIRLRAMAFTFIFAIMFVIIQPFVDLMFGDPIMEMKVQQLVLTMLLMYIIMYFLQKQSM